MLCVETLTILIVDSHDEALHSVGCHGCISDLEVVKDLLSPVGKLVVEVRNNTVARPPT